MPVRELSADVVLDPPRSTGAHELPSDASLDVPPKTTAPGVAASAARGLAPYAAGAGIGAAMGAPFAGVGAVPGAVAGIAATGATELAGTVYNPVARHFGWSEMLTPQQLTDKAMDVLGIRRPSTPLEHAVETGAGMLPMGVGSSKGAADLAGAIATTRVADAERFIDKLYTKAVRPTVVGKGTAARMEQAEAGVRSALDSIITNKANLTLADKYGREVSGRLPQTLDEFVQAIGQTRQAVFQRYDAMAKDAEALGAKVDVQGAVAELRRFAADPSMQLEKFKAVRSYAEKMADDLMAAGTYDPTVAQKTIKNLNEGLTPFYRSSSPEAAGKAAVDDLVANRLRGGLDAAIEQAGLPGYQELKNAYGALKSIEGEVAHRAIVYDRRDPAGGVVGRLGSLATAGELAQFVTRFDPSALATAGAIRGSRMWLERFKGPDQAINRMFKRAEQYHEGLSQPVRSRAAGEVEPPPTRPMEPTTAGGTPREASGIPGQPKPGVPRLAGGTSQEALPMSSARQAPLRRQLPRGDVENLLGGPNELF